MSELTVEPCTKAPADALPFHLDYIPEKLKIRAKSELLEDENTIDQKLELLRSMLKEEQNLYWQDDDLFLLAFLRVRKFDVKRAFTVIKGFYTILGKHGHIYYNLNLDKLKKYMEFSLYHFLPVRERDGSIVLLFRYTDWDPSVFSAEESLVCISLGLIEALLSPATQIAGVKIICDFKDCSVRHLLGQTPSCLSFFFQMMQNCIPVRMQGLHVINENHFFSYLWSVAKVFMTKKFSDRVKVHGKDLQGLHKFFDPSILPAEFGGNQPPFDNTSWRKQMENSFDYIRHVLSFGYEKYLKKYAKNSTDVKKEPPLTDLSSNENISE